MITPRKAVSRFAQGMEQKLRDNDHKPGWHGSAVSELLERLKEEVSELDKVLNEYVAPEVYADWVSRIADESYDVGNFAMMIADVMSAMVKPTVATEHTILTDLRDLAHKIETQDSACTSDPYYTVHEKVRDYGIEEGYGEHGWVWVLDGEEVDPDEWSKDTERDFDPDDPPRGFSKVCYRERWEHVQAFMTQDAAKAFMAREAHNHGELRTYVVSACRNPEMRAMRALPARALVALTGLTEYAILVDQDGDVTLTESRHVAAVIARNPCERVVAVGRHATWDSAKEWRESFGHPWPEEKTT